MSGWIRAAALSLCVAAGVGGAQAQTVTDAALVVENVKTAGALNRPISVVFLSASDMLIAEQHTGQVRRMTNGAVAAGNVLDLAVATSSEQGLLSMVKHPDFATNNFIYLYYTASSTASDGGSDAGNIIARYTWNGTALTGGTPSLTLPSTPGDNHNGGILVAGPSTSSTVEQKLYCVIGDLNRTGKLQNFAAGANPDDTGVILRLNFDLTTPSDNPFFGVAGANASLQRTFAYGIRNSFGMDFDPVSAFLWETENGPGPTNAFDEINLVEPGMNGGWRDHMGPFPGGADQSATSRVNLGPTDTYSNPEFSWQNAVAPAGIHFMRGNGLGGAYLHDCFVGDNNNSRIYKFEMTADRKNFVLSGDLADKVYNPSDVVTPILFGQGFAVPVDIETGPDGHMYVVSLFGNTIYRIRSITAVEDWSMY